MAEVTLQDLADMISKLATKDELAAVRANIEAVRAEVKTVRAEVNALDAKVEAHRADTAAHRADTAAHRIATAAGFAALDVELGRHAEKTHRDLDDDITAIHKGLVRAKIPGIPKDLPSQVRAKDARPSKSPKKKTAKRR